MIDGQKSIYIAVLNQGEIAVELAQCIDGIIAMSPYPIFIDYSCEKPISYNRNQIVKRFLERPQYDYLMMIDSDIVPPPDYLKLVDFQKDIISGVCFAFTKQNIFPLVLKKSKRKNEGYKYHPYESFHPDKWTGLIEVDAIGTGAMIMSRKVLEAIPYPFRNEYDKTGEKQIGLDLNFCLRAKKLGFQVFCHTDYWCSHHTRMDLKVLYKTMSQAFDGIEELNYQVDRLKKQNETLTGKLNNFKNTEKDKKKGKGIANSGNSIREEKDSILNAEGKDVQSGGSEISSSPTLKANIVEKVEIANQENSQGSENIGTANPDAITISSSETSPVYSEPNPT